MDAEPGLVDGPRTTTGRPFLIVLLIVAVSAMALSLLIRGPSSVRKAPVIQVEGWLNGPGPTAEELHGKVIVLDAWAFWCMPCRAQAPDLVRLHKQYRDRGVVFLGLTIEGIEADAQNKRFLHDTKITWPNGYGAEKMFQELKADTIPQRWVIDRQYNLIWNEASPEPIEAAIDRALAVTP